MTFWGETWYMLKIFTGPTDHFWVWFIHLLIETATKYFRTIDQMWQILCCVLVCERKGQVKRVNAFYIYIYLVYKWRHCSWSIKTVSTEPLRVCVSKCVTSLFRCELKMFRRKNQSAAANMRGELRSRDRGARTRTHTHTRTGSQGGFNATEAELLSDCDTQPRQELRN